MSSRRTVVLTEARARQLLRRAGSALIAVVLGLIVGVLLLPVVPALWSNQFLLGGIAVLIAAGLWFFGTLGHLAAGIGRSPVYWCGGTFIAQKVLFIFAWVVAWALMRKAIDDTYRRGPAAA